MNIATTIIGAVAVLFGIVMTVMRIVRPDKMAKLKPMQERYGERAGYIVHLVFYSILPIIFGAVMLSAGLMGIALF